MQAIYWGKLQVEPPLFESFSTGTLTAMTIDFYEIQKWRLKKETAPRCRR